MTALIVDDERPNLEALFLLLKRFCPEVTVVGMETDPVAALHSIHLHEPDIVFLDVQFPTSISYSWVDKIPGKCHVVIMSAYEKYAVRAFRHIQIADFLLKPIDSFELIEAINKIRKKMGELNQSPTVAVEHSFVTLNRLSFATQDGIIFIDTDDIIRFEGDGVYSTIYSKNLAPFMVSKNLGALEKMVQYVNMVRIHKSHIVNVSQISKYTKGEGGQITLQDGTSLPVSKDRKEHLLGMLNYNNNAL